jgi:hypothetical protein
MFAEKYGLSVLLELDIFVEEFATTNAGIAEVVIPPDSKVIGKCPRELLFRKTYGLSLLAIPIHASGLFSSLDRSKCPVGICRLYSHKSAARASTFPYIPPYPSTCSYPSKESLAKVDFSGGKFRAL